MGDVLGDGLTELVEVESGRVAVDADEVGSGAGCGTSDEVLDEPLLDITGKFASSSGHGGG